MRQGRLGREEDALDVDREDLVPGRLVGVDDVAVALDPGRCDERVEPPESIDRGGHRRLHGARVGHVGHDRQRLTARVPDRLDRCLDGVDFMAPHADRGTLGRAN